MIIRRVNLARLLVLITTTLFMMNAASATLNCIIITDPTGQDPNGAAAGSMSFDENMFQSTFIFSPADKFAILSGGVDTTSTTGGINDTPRLSAVISSINILKANGTAQAAASVANSYTGQRLVVGGPTIGAALTGTSGNYLIVVANDGTITVAAFGLTHPGQG